MSKHDSLSLWKQRIEEQKNSGMGIREWCEAKQLSFGKDPFEETCVFLFCNKRKDSIKVLRFDGNGFILTQKKLLEEMKFRWPKEKGELKQIFLSIVE